MPFKKGNTIGKETRFKGDVIGPGRTKKSVLMDNIRKLAKAAPVTERDIKEGYQWLQGQSIETLKEVAGNTRDYPAFLSIGARELIGKYAFDAAETMNNRVYGKPRQQQEVTVTDEKLIPQIVILPPKEEENDGSEN